MSKPAKRTHSRHSGANSWTLPANLCRPGSRTKYGFDDIGNRKTAAAGGGQSGAGLRPASYSANLLNQYTNRTVPGGFDVLGAASATNSVTVNGSPADYRHGEFFQELITANNTNATIWQSVKVTNSTSGAYETGAVFLAQSPEAFTHDADGNLLSDGRWDYTWDGENRLVTMVARTATGPQQRIEFSYDWQSRRVSKKVWNNTAGSGTPALDLCFLYDGWNLLAVLDPQFSILQQFMWGLDLSGSLQGAGGVGGLVKVYDTAASKHYFPAYDGNGNVMALTDGSTGAEAARYEYGPFGELLTATGSYATANPFRFSTKFTDNETGMLYYGYRYYIPHTGRWASRDPIGERGGRNIYQFSYGDPIRHIDSRGLYAECPGAWEKILARCACKAASGGEAGSAGGPIGIAACVLGAIATELITIDVTLALEVAQLQKENEEAVQRDAEKNLEYDKLKQRCAQKPPPDLEAHGNDIKKLCALWRWQLERNKDCIKLQYDFSKKWYNGPDARHQRKIDEIARGNETLEDKIKRLCEPCPNPGQAK